MASGKEFQVLIIRFDKNFFNDIPIEAIPIVDERVGVQVKL